MWQFKQDFNGIKEAVKVLIWNLRWNLGYKIGGFTSAYRANRK